MHASVKREKIKGTGNSALTPVQGLLERSIREKASRVKLAVINGTKRSELQGNVRKYVLKGAAVNTDALASYNGLSDEYTHGVVDHAVKYVDGTVHTNGLENFWSLLKRTVKGTYVRPAAFHLFRYLDEQAYRFNERKGTDQSRFMGAVRTAKDRSLTWRKLTGKSERKP